MRKLRLEEIPRTAPDQVTEQVRHPISVVVDNVRSIYNVGSIFRTSDAAMVEHLFLTGYTGTPKHRGLRKTALGAEKTVGWSHHQQPREALRQLKDNGYTIAALEITDQPTATDAVPMEAFPLALIVGNEVDGVQESLIEDADLALELPQFGSKHSLNVAVAYGIAIYDIVRRYRSLTSSEIPPAPRDLI